MFLLQHFVPSSACHELRRQEAICRELGSPFVANVLQAAERQLHLAPATLALMEEWPGDPGPAALALRLYSAVHALARCERVALLTALFARRTADFDGALAAAFSGFDPFIAEWMQHPTQTNEVGRTAAMFAGLAMLAGRGPQRFELLEMGASCGLNLNMGRYAFSLGGEQGGVPSSPVRLEPEWRGNPPPPLAGIEITGGQGVDLRPLDAADAATRQRLLSYIWADQPRRVDRLERALDLARQFPPAVVAGRAGPWLLEQLSRPQQPGVCRVVLHSMVLQYIAPEEREMIIAALDQAGQRARSETPLASLAFEWTADRSEVTLTLTTWPGGTSTVLAGCHPYGEWIDWRG